MRLLLALAATLVLAAPAAASERSEARALIAALQPEIVLTPEEQEAIVLDWESRAADVAATCMDDVRAAARKPVRTLMISVPYFGHVAAALNARLIAWAADSAVRLDAVPLASLALRRGRVARSRQLRREAALATSYPADFCAELRAWRAGAWKGRPATFERLDERVDQPGSLKADQRAVAQAARILRRAGADGAQVRAWRHVPAMPEFRDPQDPVLEILLDGFTPDRQSGGPTRGRW